MTHAAGDAHPYPIYGYHFLVTFPILDADGDPVAGATALDSEVSKDLGTFADCTNEATELATNSGVYYLYLTGAEMTAKIVTVRIQTSSAGAKTTVLTLHPIRLPILESDVAEAGAGSTITLAVATASAEDNFYNGMFVVITDNDAAGSQYQARRVVSYVGSTRVATVDSAWGTNPSSSSNYDILIPEGYAVKQWGGGKIPKPTVAGVPNVNAKTWNDLTTVALPLVPATAGRTVVVDAAGLVDANMVKLGPTGSGTAQTARDVGASVLLSAGTGAGQLDFTSGVVKANLAQILGTAITETAGQIAAAFKQFFDVASPTGTMKAITNVVTTTTATNLTTNNDKTGYALSSAGVQAIWDALTSALTTVGSIGKRLVDDITGDIFARLGAPAGVSVSADIAATKALLPAALVSGRIDASVGAMASGVVTATAIAADAIGASELAADAVAEIADQVWDELIADHLGAGATGAALNAAGGAGDPWITALPGAYGAGSAGKIVGDNLNATVSSVKAKTDNLPSDPADESVLEGLIAAVQADTDNIQTRLPAALTANGNMKSSMVEILTTALTETAGLLAGGFKKFFNVASPTGTLNSIPDAVPDAAGGLPVTGTRLTSIPWNAAWDAEVESEATDALNAYDAPTHTELTAELATADDAVLAAIAALNNLSQANIRTAVGLASANLDTQLSTIDDFLDTEIAAILAAVDTEVAAIKAVTDLLTAAQAEPTGVPAANATPLTKLGILYAMMRNSVTVTATKKQFFNDGGTAEFEKDLSDNGTTYTETKVNGP